MVKDAIKDQVVTYIPKDVLYLEKTGILEKKEAFSQTINRIKWIDYSTLLVVNEDGVEKMLNIDNGFEEISYNFRPLFTSISPIKGLENKEYLKDPYYFKRSELQHSNLLNRLQRLYQEYKSDYYLYKKKTYCEFYETLLTVDKTDWYYN